MSMLLTNYPSINAYNDACIQHAEEFERDQKGFYASYKASLSPEDQINLEEERLQFIDDYFREYELCHGPLE